MEGSIDDTYACWDSIKQTPKFVLEQQAVSEL